MSNYPEVAFHATPARNVSSILKTGLEPLIGKLSQELGELEPRVYLFSSEEDLSCAMLNWLGDCIEESEEPWSILKVSLKEEISKQCTQEAFELQCPVVIPPECIEVLCADADEFMA